jgi:hypothetical protein
MLRALRPVRPGKKNDPTCPVPFYTYPVDVIKRAIQLVTGALTSLRGASKCLDIFSDIYTCKIPSHTAIQNWILQYGLNELMRPIEKREDWILILDHTIEFGHQKCLVILGIRQEDLLKTAGPITHQQLRTLVIDISGESNSKRIHDTLNTLMKKTGIPVQIVSDHGPDLKKAITDICHESPGVRFTYDITHKCGLLVKTALSRDILWNRFIENYSYTKRKCVHSRFAFLSPTKLRDKSRWMNLDTCVDWANKIMKFEENLADNTDALHLEMKDYATNFQEIFGWIHRFSERIRRWGDILNVVSIARDEVKANGLTADTSDRFYRRIENISIDTDVVRVLTNDLYGFLCEQTKSIPVGQKFLGSSDAIESVFAKYKNFSARTPMKGVGKTVLTIPVFLSQITADKVTGALQSCPNKKVSKWLSDKIGQSVFAQRVRAFAN